MFSFSVFIKSGARVVAFDQHHAVLVVSKPSPNQLFPGFGVVKVSIKMYMHVHLCLYPMESLFSISSQSTSD